MTTYLTDKQGKFIPATQRPDGTWRKARRVRSGYVPQEEVPLYESKGKQFAQRKPILPPGLYVDIPSEKINKSKKDPTGGNVALYTNNNNNNNNNYKKQQQQSKQQMIPGVLKLPASTDTATATTACTSLTTMPTIPPHSTTSTQNSGGQKMKHSSIHVQCNNLCDNLEQQLRLSDDDVHAENQKRMKKLRKKLREIEQIEEKMKNGTLKNPEKDQLDKIKRKKQIQIELSSLEVEHQEYERRKNQTTSEINETQQKTGQTTTTTTTTI